MATKTILANARVGTSPDTFDVHIDGSRIARVLPSTGMTGPRIFDCGGRTLLPGINDSHLHAYEYGRALTATDLRGARDLGELRAILGSSRPESTGWYRGHGWESTSIHGSGPDHQPTAKDIDDSTAHGPALLVDSTGHAALVNSAALALAGIGSGTQDPQGGVIVRYANGDPTGLLLESAVSLVTRVVPDITGAERKAALRTAQADLLSRGITAVTDPGLGPGGTTLMDGTGTLDAVEAYRELDETQELLLRTHLMLLFGGLGGTTSADVSQGLDMWGPPKRALGESRLSIDQVKVFADGIPRSRTAWLSEPYDNCTHGHMTIAGDTDDERVAELNSIVQAAALRGWQVGTHCTGDATISAFITAVSKTTDPPSLRHYVIHGDLIKHGDIPRLAALGMGLNSNPSIRWTVGRRVSPIIGEARNLAKQPLRSLVQGQVSLASSSDAPVVEPDWRVILAAAMTRSLREDSDYTDHQTLSPEQALATMTAAAAWQSHDDSWLGSIKAGYAADLVLLDDAVDWQDPWSLPSREVSAVLIDGHVVHGSLT